MTERTEGGSGRLPERPERLRRWDQHRRRNGGLDRHETAMMTYSLNAYLPWEGYRAAFNGTKGRIEVEVRESAYVNAGDDASIEGAVKSKSITVFPMFGRPYVVPVEEAKGGHGGGDPRLLEDLFGTKQPDRFKRLRHIDGALSSNRDSCK